MKATEKPFRVLDIGAGKGPVFDVIKRRFPNRKIEYHGIDDFSTSPFAVKKRNAPIVETEGRATRVFHVESLNFSDPLSFEQSLRSLVGGNRFDEIHFHMPQGTGGDLITRPHAAQYLQALHRILIPGGRIFHLTQFQPFEHPTFWLGQVVKHEHEGHATMVQEHLATRQKVGAVAKAGGFRLEQFAQLMEGPNQYHYGWMAQPAAASAAKKVFGHVLNPRDSRRVDRLNEKIARQAHQLTRTGDGFFGYSGPTAFVVLKKPRKTPKANVPG